MNGEKQYRKFRAKRRSALSDARCGHRLMKPSGAKKWCFAFMRNGEKYPCTICPGCGSTDARR